MHGFMNRYGFGAVLIVSACVLTAATASASVIWSEGFEGYNVGNDIRNTNGWGTSNFAASHVVQDVSDAVNPSKAVNLAEGVSTNRALSRPLEEAVSGGLRLTFDVLNTATNTVMYFWFAGQSPAGTGTLRLYFGAPGEGAGSVRLWGSGFTVTDTTISSVYDPNAWYRAVVDFSLSEADPDTSTYSVQVFELLNAAEGTLGDRVAHIGNASVVGMRNFTSFQIFAAGSSQMDLKLDNIRLIPEPGTAGLLLAGLAMALSGLRARNGVC